MKAVNAGKTLFSFHSQSLSYGDRKVEELSLRRVPFRIVEGDETRWYKVWRDFVQPGGGSSQGTAKGAGKHPITMQLRDSASKQYSGESSDRWQETRMARRENTLPPSISVCSDALRSGEMIGPIVKPLSIHVYCLIVKSIRKQHNKSRVNGFVCTLFLCEIYSNASILCATLQLDLYSINMSPKKNVIH